MVETPEAMRSIRLWLYSLAALIAVMVLVGGATRLTDSGLSITEWAPIRGIVPPLSLADWNAEFLAYQTTTEFQTVNSAMTLPQFKFIYWWEWGHRFLGRLIGLWAVLPLIWFWAKGRLSSWMKPRLVGLVALGGLQGFIGWWMVKSGLVNRVDVSQIRLAVHLGMAFILFGWTIWLARSLAVHSGEPQPQLRWQGAALSLFVLVQVFMGGLVAGLDAGMGYTTWPKMAGAWVPDGLLAASPWWVNFTDNALTVQFVHRITAYGLWIAVLFHVFSVRAAAADSVHARRAMVLLALVTAQAMVGIITLVLQVPLHWALMHQFGAVIVLGFTVAHWHAFQPHLPAAQPSREAAAGPASAAAALPA